MLQKISSHICKSKPYFAFLWVNWKNICHAYGLWGSIANRTAANLRSYNRKRRKKKRKKKEKKETSSNLDLDFQITFDTLYCMECKLISFLMLMCNTLSDCKTIFQRFSAEIVSKSTMSCNGHQIFGRKKLNLKVICYVGSFWQIGYAETFRIR